MHRRAGGPRGGRFAHRTGERKFSKRAGVQRIVLGGLLLFVLLKVLVIATGEIIGCGECAHADAARFQALLEVGPMLAQMLKIAFMQFGADLNRTLDLAQFEGKLNPIARFHDHMQ
jgi:hypothetical protein